MDPIMGTIMLFAGNFQVRGFIFCNGQLMSIEQNSALFSILGTTYGGDGIQTFGIPDLRGRTPVGTGTGNGLSNVQLGQMGGIPNTTLTLANLPAHSHPLTVQVEVSSVNAGSDEAAGGFLTTTSSNFYATSGGGGHLGGPNGASGVAGGNVPFNTESPYLGLNYLMVTEGIYPSRS